MSTSDPKRHGDAQPPEHGAMDADALFSPQLRAALRRELGPDAGARARVRDALWSSVAVGALSPAAQRVDALLHSHAAAAGGGKLAAAAGMHSLGTKLVLAGVLVAGGASAVVMRAPRTQEPAQIEATSGAKPVSAPTSVVAAAEAAKPAEEAAPSIDGQAVPLPAAIPVVRRDRHTAHANKSAARVYHSAEAALADQVRAAATPAADSGEEKRALAANPSPAAQATEATSAPPKVLPSQAEPAASASTPKHELAAELALVRAASDALQRGDAQAALAQLQRHATRFPNGALVLEVDALRAIALCRAGSPAAAAVSGKFLKQHAGSPLAERVRRACSQSSEH